MLSSQPKDIKREQNVSSQIRLISDSGMLQYVSADRGLVNFFTMKSANAQQSDDMLNFRDIGQREFLIYISYYILNVPSTTGTLRKRRLQTLSSKKVTKQRLSQLQKDRNLIVSCMHKKIQWSQRTGRPLVTGGEQLIALPLAISDHQGNPIKGQKSTMTKALAVRYKTIIMNDYPEGWQPQCCLMEGMFLINVTPLGCHVTFGNYAQFLMQRYILPHFSKGCSEVHIVFDNPGQLKNSPKFFEQKRRDHMAVIANGHNCEEIKAHNRLPSKWRDNVLNCRKCKRALISFLGNYMLENIHMYLRSLESMFYIAGAFEGPATNTSWFVKGKDDPQPNPEFTCNGEEADTIIWLHASKTECKNILIMSPDTDVYLIGLPLPCTKNKHILVQVSPMSSREVKLICTESLNRALSNDPDLATIPQNSHSNVIQTLFVVSGCDYISFFSGIGKATFTKHFYQHAEFITGDTHYTSGSLVNTQLDETLKTGFLAFLRLIGTVYFKKHASAFDLLTPESHFKTFTCTSTEKQHHEWIDSIRQKSWDRSVYESDTVPSTEALWRHWMRSCWVLDMWRQSHSSNMNLALLTNFGWSETGSGIAIDWDSEDNLQAVQQRILMLTKGCKCKTGCVTGRCKCYKKDQKCLEGCSCQNCKNLPVYENAEDRMELEIEETSGLYDQEIEEERELDELEFEEDEELDELENEEMDELENEEMDELENEEMDELEIEREMDELEIERELDELEIEEENWN